MSGAAADRWRRSPPPRRRRESMASIASLRVTPKVEQAATGAKARPVIRPSSRSAPPACCGCSRADWPRTRARAGWARPTCAAAAARRRCFSLRIGDLAGLDRARRRSATRSRAARRGTPRAPGSARVQNSHHAILGELDLVRRTPPRADGGTSPVGSRSRGARGSRRSARLRSGCAQNRFQRRCA